MGGVAAGGGIGGAAGLRTRGCAGVAGAGTCFGLPGGAAGAGAGAVGVRGGTTAGVTARSGAAGRMLWDGERVVSSRSGSIRALMTGRRLTAGLTTGARDRLETTFPSIRAMFFGSVVSWAAERAATEPVVAWWFRAQPAAVNAISATAPTVTARECFQEQLSEVAKDRCRNDVSNQAAAEIDSMPGDDVNRATGLPFARFFHSVSTGQPSMGGVRSGWAKSLQPVARRLNLERLLHFGMREQSL